MPRKNEKTDEELQAEWPKYYSYNDDAKEDIMGGAGNKHGGVKNYYTFLLRTSEGKKQLWRRKRRWEHDTKMDHKK